MNDNEIRRYDAFVRIRQFGTDNAADFPAGSIGATQFGVIDTEIGLIDSFTGNQAAGGGAARQGFVVKDTARENLREAMYEISRTARSMEYQFDGIAAKFRMPVNFSDQNLLAVARAFFDESLPYEGDFKTYGLSGNFRADLQIDITAFEDSMNPTGTAIDEQVAATAEIGEAIRRGMIARRILDGVVKNKYAANVGKLAAWLSASHIDRPPVKKKPLPPPV